jgi:hypothetical protein
MKENIQLLNFLRSNKFILYVALFTVIFLSPNTYYVFYSFSVLASPYREVASGGVALIVAASIMIYTLRKNYEMARNYSLFEMMISGYYYVTMIGWDWGLIPALGFTVMLPLSVQYYTKEIDVDIDHNDKKLKDWLEKNPDKRPTDYYLENK